MALFSYPWIDSFYARLPCHICSLRLRRSSERLSRISGYSILGLSYAVARTAMSAVWIAAIL
jgi:hypothetical protein